MSDDEREIRELIRTWLTASAEGDVERVVGLMSDDIVFITPGRPPFGREAFIEASKKGSGRVDIDARSEVEEVTILGDLAYARTLLQIKVIPKDGGTPVQLSGWTLSIYRRLADGWRLIRDANLLAPEPRPTMLQAAIAVLQVASVAASIAWYRDVLGFAANPFGRTEDPDFAILTRESVELMLQKVEGCSARGRSDHAIDLYVRVRDLESCRAVASLRIGEVGPIEARAYGCREFRLTDLDGHVLVVGQCD